MITKTISLLGDSLSQLGIVIEIIPTDDPVIKGYPNEFYQVILNILNNANDAFLTKTVGTPKITITVCCANDKTVVRVIDNAGGISNDIIERIFEPYFTTKGPDKGTGVGLYMSKTIIERNMNGTLSARNVGDGAEFRIVI